MIYALGLRLGAPGHAEETTHEKSLNCTFWKLPF
jgi:hypothetical protein